MHDRLQDLPQRGAVLGQLPNARVEILEGLGHGIALLAPRACAEMAVSFWDDIDGRT